MILYAMRGRRLFTEKIFLKNLCLYRDVIKSAPPLDQIYQNQSTPSTQSTILHPTDPFQPNLHQPHPHYPPHISPLSNSRLYVAFTSFFPVIALNSAKILLNPIPLSTLLLSVIIFKASSAVNLPSSTSVPTNNITFLSTSFKYLSVSPLKMSFSYSVKNL